MCYTKPGPRCASHAVEQVATASRKYQRSVEKVQAAQASVDSLEAKGVAGEKLDKAKGRLYEAQTKMHEAKTLLRHRRHNYEITPEGREKLAARALAYYRAGRMREWEATNRQIDRNRAEYDVRLRDFHQLYGSNPDQAQRGKPTPDRMYPNPETGELDSMKPLGGFEPEVGWANYEQTENALWEDVNREYAQAQMAARPGDKMARVSEGMGVLMAAISPDSGEWDSGAWDRAILAARKSRELQDASN